MVSLIQYLLVLLVSGFFLGGFNAAEAQVTYTVGGALSGLPAGKSLILQNNGNPLTLSANGAFTFSGSIASGASYAVSVGIQPTGAICSVSGGTGIINSANVTNVGVTCASTYTVGGSISGLTKSGLVLLLNGSNSKIVAINSTSFVFSSALKSGASYSVTVGIRPVGMTCSISNNLGIIGSVNVTNVAVSCASVYTVGGSISGLTKSGLVLKLNGEASKIVVSNSTSYVFSSALSSGASYTVTVQIQPEGLTCTLSNGSGAITNANVTNANLTCAINTIPIIYTYSYDALGHISHAAGSDGSSIDYHYDANGNVTMIKRQ